VNAWIHLALRWRKNIHAVVGIHPPYCAAVRADGRGTVHRTRAGDAAARDHRRAHVATHRQHGRPHRLRCRRTVDRREAASHLPADVRQAPSPQGDRAGLAGSIG